MNSEHSCTIGGRHAGRVTCKTDRAADGSGLYAYIIWTDDGLDIYAFAFTDPGARSFLYSWWLNDAGPTH